ncbi:MAG: SseB family protein [Pseudomonadota bacterium]
MEPETHLDRAHAAMEASEADEPRLRFYEALAAVELFLLLDGSADGDTIVPQAFEVEGQAFVLAFDTEARLARFAGSAADYVALSGRALAEMLTEQSLGLGLNLEVASSALLLPPEGLAWLAQALADDPLELEAQAREFHPPAGLPESLLTALDARLAAAEGLAGQAYLVGVTYQSGARGHMLGFVDAAPGAEDALARAVSDVLRFSDLEAAVLDVGFFRAQDQAAARMSVVGLRFDLPTAKKRTAARTAPGLDPDTPPKLR